MQMYDEKEECILKVIIVGGVAGGASAATRMRRMDETAEIIMFERDSYVSYANCGLPYHIGNIIQDKEILLINTPEELKNKFALDVRIRQEVTSVDRERKVVTVLNLEDGISYEESYDKLLLSPGSVCIRPDIPGIDSGKIFYFRTISDMNAMKEFILNQKPEKAAIVGAGFVGVELAENLMEIGIQPVIIEKSAHVFQALDIDVASDVHAYLRGKGVQLILGNGLTEIVDSQEGVVLKLDDGEISADMIIISIGMKPDNTLAAGCGLDMTDQGVLIVDEHMQTSDENIYAAGDAVQVKNVVTGFDDYLPLAGPANKQGRIAADNICGVENIYHGSQGTSICKVFDMTVAWTGLSEKKAELLNLDFDKIYLWSNDHASFYPDMSHITIKVIFEKKDGRILGAELVGFSGVDKRCDVFAAAIRAGMTGSDLANLECSYAPPYASAKEPVNMAGFVIENVVSGRINMIHWNELDDFIAKKNPQIIDVRPVNAYMDDGYIEGAKSIPFEQFRKRYAKKIDKERPVLLYCNMGLNSYTCSRMLSQLGYECYSLAGGYRLYSSAVLGSWKPEIPKTSCGLKIDQL